MSEHIPIKDVTPIKLDDANIEITKSNYATRSRIYVRSVKGFFESLKQSLGLVMIGLFMLAPWVQYEGRQALLFDLAEQRFNIFGLTLWPQDLTILAYLLIVSAFGLFFVTTFVGRVWCGFTCPQTAWTHIFIWFEEKFEGPRNKRIKLDQRKMDKDKLLRKSAKHLAWITFSLLTALSFVSYFVPVQELFINFFTLEVGFWTAFWVIFFAACTYGNAGYMREVMCTHMCPYARFQSAMFDKDTYTVAYNAQRGENRGPRSRKLSLEQIKEKGLGECIDCNLCVQVCPTGIDIRNGLQYECINCGACVDACNSMMQKMGYQKGLISYTSEHQLSGGETKIFRPKLIGYAVVLAVMSSLLVYDIMSRVPLEVDIIRDRNSLDRETSQGLIENVYTLKVLNKSQQQSTYTIEILGLEGANYNGDNRVTVDAGGLYTLPISVAVAPEKLQEGTQKLYFKVATTLNGEVVETVEPSTFIYTGAWY